MNHLERSIIMLALLFEVGSASAMAAPSVMPKEQAAHFCQLFLYDGNNIMPLSHHARRLMKSDTHLQSTDSCVLTPEQMFTSYILYQENWRSLRLFPHNEGGTISWYAPADDIPESIGEEHKKYIHEVMPRLKAEVQAGHWQTVDAYIDKMIEYQCRFSGNGTSTATISAKPIYVIAFFFLINLVLYLFIRNFAPQKEEINESVSYTDRI